MISPKKMKFYGLRDINSIPQLDSIPEDQRFAIKVISSVLPFRVNNYVLEELINWDSVPDDPIFQLTFMQKDMLSENQFGRMADALRSGIQTDELNKTVEEIRLELNPHPAGQMTLNVPRHNGKIVRGVQHKYRETVLMGSKSRR